MQMNDLYLHLVALNLLSALLCLLACFSRSLATLDKTTWHLTFLVALFEHYCLAFGIVKLCITDTITDTI